ncbi:hypothetical protein BH23ACT7_BH23ACT7_05390 [soil metagenome]|jgi:hypothetical protein|nr:hypothetical protein [Euzebyaceae bacterium]
MARERKNAPTADTAGRRTRRRTPEQPEIELTDEELRALADDGLDPDEVRRVATEPRPEPEASEHDRDTARDDLEGLVLEQDEEY